MDDNSVQIQIMGQKFFLQGTHDKAYIERIERHINKKIEEVRQSGGSADSYNLMILVALNLVDDCLKKEDEISGLQKAVDESTEKLIAYIDKHF